MPFFWFVTWIDDLSVSGSTISNTTFRRIYTDNVVVCLSMTLFFFVSHNKSTNIRFNQNGDVLMFFGWLYLIFIALKMDGRQRKIDKNSSFKAPHNLRVNNILFRIYEIPIWSLVDRLWDFRFSSLKLLETKSYIKIKIYDSKQRLPNSSNCNAPCIFYGMTMKLW